MSKTETAPEKKRSYHVNRGGTVWYSIREVAQALGRRLDDPEQRYRNLGVRLVEVIDEQG